MTSSGSWFRGGRGFAGFTMGIMATAAASAAQASFWSVQSYQFNEQGRNTQISVIGGPTGGDPLAGLDGLRRPGGRLEEGIIHLTPGQNPQSSKPGPKTYLYRLGGGNHIIENFRPQADRLVILGAAAVNLMAINREAVARLPDGATITLREMPTAL